MKSKNPKLRFIGAILVIASCTYASAAESGREPSPAIKEIVDCSIIRIAELLYIFDNSDSSPKNQHIRSWIMKRVRHQIRMMETVKLTPDQKEFVRKVQNRLKQEKS
jgi:hypothetical protein